MADFTSTITNTLNVLAADTTSQWNTLEWGTDNWGSTGDVTVTVDKVITDSTAITTQIDHVAEFFRDITDTTAITTAICLDSAKIISAGSVTLTNALHNLTLVDSEGYFHIFRGDTSEGEDQIISSYNEVTGSDSTWTPVTDASTTWNED